MVHRAHQFREWEKSPCIFRLHSGLRTTSSRGQSWELNLRKIPLEDCKIDGDDFSFKVSTKWEDTDMTHYYTGTFLGDVLRMSLKTDMGFGPGPQTEFIAKRSNF